MNSFLDRLRGIASDITLPDDFDIVVGRDLEIPNGRYYFQIECWRKDAITGEMGTGRGGKAYLDERASDSQLVQTVFGLYRGYLEHEARETFQWKGRRIYGPHINIEAQWEVARRVDIPSAQHVGDQP